MRLVTVVAGKGRRRLGGTKQGREKRERQGSRGGSFGSLWTPVARKCSPTGCGDVAGGAAWRWRPGAVLENRQRKGEVERESEAGGLAEREGERRARLGGDDSGDNGITVGRLAGDRTQGERKGGLVG